MIELIIFIFVAAALLTVYIWPHITWNGEDWKHLRLPDDWDAAKSRGRIKERNI